VPNIALAIRRLHDTGRSGWVYLLCCIGSCCCGIGLIVFIIFMCLPSIPGPNQYGPNPYSMNNMGGNGYGGNGYGGNGYGGNMGNMGGNYNNYGGFQQ